MSADVYPALYRAPDGDHPLVFAFHGTGGDEHQLFEVAQQLAPGAGVISPRGDVSEGGMARFFRRTGEGMYDMDDLARATDKVITFVEAHHAQHAGRPVFAFGYSNGANILASVFLKRPELFDRVGLLHPLVTWDPQPNSALAARKVLITAGRRDPITPWQMSEQLIAWLTDQGADVQTEIHDGGHELRNAELIAVSSLFAAKL